MKTNIQDRIKANPQLAANIERASELLRRQLGRSENIVTVDWTLERSTGSTLSIHLKIADPMASVEATFTAPELADEWFMNKRLGQLWGDLLQERSHILLDRILQDVSSGGGDD